MAKLLANLSNCAALNGCSRGVTSSVDTRGFLLCSTSTSTSPSTVAAAVAVCRIVSPPPRPSFVFSSGFPHATAVHCSTAVVTAAIAAAAAAAAAVPAVVGDETAAVAAVSILAGAEAVAEDGGDDGGGAFFRSAATRSGAASFSSWVTIDHTSDKVFTDAAR